MNSISSFSGNYRFLSNFYPCEIMYDGWKYRSVEHAFQAAKSMNLDVRRKIRLAPRAGQAKRLGRTVFLRDGWESIRLEIMQELVFRKFYHDMLLRKKLLATGELILIEGNLWNDRFWGVCKGEGENHLGRILMNVRQELRGE